MSHVCEQLVDALRYLESHGMPEHQLARLHHDSLKGRGVSFNQGIEYFSTNRDLRGNNSNYAERVKFVAAEHRREGKSFGVLVEGALAKWPL